MREERGKGRVVGGEPRTAVQFENVLARLSAVSEQRLPIGNVSCWAGTLEMFIHGLDAGQGQVASV